MMTYETPVPVDNHEEQEETASHTERAVSSIVRIAQLVKRLQSSSSGEPLTQEEHELLATWMGWGPIAPAFEYSPQGKWKEIAAQLKMLLGPTGWEQASAATPHSYFTDRYLCESLWNIALSLGFAGGRVLEPGCGSGAVLCAAPDFLKEKGLRMTGVERDAFSATIAQARLPEAQIITNALEQVALIEDSFDLVIGNVPFSSAHIYDHDAGRTLSLHNYFLWRALRALRPGGLAILITSRYTFDAAKDEQRLMITQYGALLGAIRLPSGAHKAAGTEVVTDILVFQRRSPEIAWKGHEWLETSDTAIPGIAVNAYFADHMSSICGTPSVGHGMYGDNDLRIKAPFVFSSELDLIINRITNEAQYHGALYLPPRDITAMSSALVRFREDGQKEGSYHLVEGKLIQIVDGEQVLVSKCIPELTDLVHLRNAATTLLEQERNLDTPDEELTSLRKALNDHYDVYAQTYGAIHRAKVTIGEPDPETGERTITRRRPVAHYAFNRDPDYCIVLGLEDYDDTTKVARKAPIFERRVNVRPVKKTSADSPAEAMAICMDRYGHLDLTVIAQLLSMEEEEVPALLGDLVYEVPGTQGVWTTASEYLSGNIRMKLEEARRAVKGGHAQFQRNIDALEKIVPEDLVPEEIKALLGATWVTPEDIEQFCEETFGSRPEVGFERVTGNWQLKAPYSASYSPQATSEWGTERMHAYRITEVGLNKGTPIIYDTLADDTRVKNVDETLAAQDKLRVIQARFSEWVWEDPDRAKRLCAVYNKLFNSVVPRSYDGSHLTFEGMSAHWQEKLYSWQKDFVWRMICERSALCAHPVGAGKCLAADSIIYDPRTGLPHTLEEVVEQHIGTDIWTLANQRSITTMPIADRIDSGIKPTLRITFSSGRSVVTTPHHPFLTSDGWRRVDQIEVGETAALPSIVPFPQEPVSMSRDEIDLLALLIAEGGLTHGQVKFSTGDETMLAVANQAATSLGWTVKPIQEHYTYSINGSKRAITVPNGQCACGCGLLVSIAKHNNSKLGHVKGMPVRFKLGHRSTDGGPHTFARLHNIFNVLARNKSMPEIVYRLGPEDLGRFLGVFWMCDGYVDRRGPAIVLASEDLVRSIQHLLLRFGIQSRVAPKPSRYDDSQVFPAWRLTVYASSMERFAKFIDLWGEKRNRIIAHLTRTRNSNVGRPTVSEQLRARIKELAAPHGGVPDAVQELYNKTGTLCGPALRRLIGLKPGLNELEWLANESSELFWDRIVSIENAGNRHVYDLTVLPTHSFLANDIIVHNTSTEIAGAMTLKRMGLISKAAIVVPNHLLEQITAEAQRLYPGANILMLGRDDLTKERRKLFAARIATGDYDLVVITHSGLGAIGVHPDTEKAFIDQKIAIYKAAIMSAAEEKGGKKYSVKKLETAVEKLYQRQKELLDRPHDDGVTFEQLGISYLVIDECFPYDTPVLTNYGLLPIGRIVEEQLDVTVASVNLQNGIIEWKPVVRRIRKQAHSLVKVTHEKGEFTCTPNHKIWVEGKGYTQAGELISGETLRVLPEAIHTRESTQDVLPTALCRSDVSSETTNEMGDTYLRILRETLRANTQDPKVLHDSVFSEVAHVSSPSKRTVKTSTEDDGTSSNWKERPSIQCSNESQQPNEQPSYCRESEEVEDRKCWPSLERTTRRQWISHCSPEASCRIPQLTDGVRYSNPASQTHVHITSESLLSGYCMSRSQDSNRSGWTKPHGKETEIHRSAQNRGLECTRVVSVEVLERGSDERDGTSRSGNTPVYNIEVADNHNYFAHGILVSNCHLYKNLGLPTNIQGMQVKASKRATDLEMKLRWLEAHNEGRPFGSGFTATPISNSMVEAYVVLWYLNQSMLESYGLYNVDAFASVFIEFQTKVEVSPNGASFRLHTRASRFVNVPEFLTIFTQIADLRDPGILSEKRPTRREHIVVIEPTEEVQAYVDTLVERSEAIQRGSPWSIGEEGKTDNMLWVTTHGRMAALDLSLVGKPQEHSPKLEAVARNMIEVYERWQVDAAFLDGEFKSLQIGFCDLGTPNQESGDQVYGRMKRALVRGGIPERGIRYIHEAKTDQGKALLFEQCRRGDVAILLGSTPMLGTGTNIQNRAAALHHLDAPWRPDEVEQREGRIQRPGNVYPEVEIFRYVQRRTFDAYSWQTLTNKAVFFDQLRSGKIKGREVEELGDSALSYGQVKAAATGDPLVLEQADLSVGIAHLQRLRTAHLRARTRDVSEAKYARQIASDTIARSDRLREIGEQASQAETPGFTPPNGTPLVDHKEIGDAIAEQVFTQLNRYGGLRYLGTYQGISLQLNVEKNGTFYNVFLILGGSRYSSTGGVTLRVSEAWIGKGQTWRFAAAIEQFIGGARDASIEEARAAQEHLARATDFDTRAREPFAQQEEITRLQKRLEALTAYTELAASSKGDQQKKEEIDALREFLLRDAPKDFSEVAVVQPKRIAPPKRPDEDVVEAPIAVVEITTEQREALPAPSVEATTFTVHKHTWESLRSEVQASSPPKRKRAKKHTATDEEEGLWSFLSSSPEREDTSDEVMQTSLFA